MATDDDMNKELYGKSLDATQIVRGGAAPVAAAGKDLVTFRRKIGRAKPDRWRIG